MAGSLPKFYYVDSNNVQHVTFDKSKADKYNKKRSNLKMIILIIFIITLIIVVLINIPGFTELFTGNDKYGPGYRY